MRRLVLLLTVLLLAAVDAIADEGAVDRMDSSPATPVAKTTQEDGAPGEVPYLVLISGVEDEAVLSLLEKSSQLIALADRPPISEAGLWRRIEDDRGRFDTVFRSEGYYEARTWASVDRSTSPPTVLIQVDLGPPFTFRSFTVEEVATADEGLPLPRLSDLGITIGARARAPDVVAAEKRLADYCANNAYPLAQTFDRHAVVDFADRTMTVSVQLDPGPRLMFGPVSFMGLGSVAEAYVRLLIPWEDGQPYDRRKVEEFRRRLVRTGLFSAVIINPVDNPNPEGQLPINVDVVEAKMHSIGAGAKYYTTEGPAVELFWEHRNLFGRSENLTVSTELGKIIQNVSFDVLIPDYRRFEQDLIGSTVGLRETTDAYDKAGIETSLRIRRKFDDIWAVSSGPSVETAWLKERGLNTENSTLFGLPSYVYRDTTNDQLDPTEGTRLRFAPTPYVGWYTQQQHFISNELSGSAYLSLDPASRYVLATRAKIGALFGESREDIPADKRFYAGGGSSIRGYPFQKVGQLDDHNNPIGGRSLLELSAEFRARVWGNFGVVPFIDGGTVYDSVVPNFSETIRWGAGLGLRYYTIIGPARLDVAFPINRRKDVDEPVQFYVNIGQAF